MWRVCRWWSIQLCSPDARSRDGGSSGVYFGFTFVDPLDFWIVRIDGVCHCRRLLAGTLDGVLEINRSFSRRQPRRKPQRKYSSFGNRLEIRYAKKKIERTGSVSQTPVPFQMNRSSRSITPAHARSKSKQKQIEYQFPFFPFLSFSLCPSLSSSSSSCLSNWNYLSECNDAIPRMRSYASIYL